MTLGRDGAPKMYARSRSVIVPFGKVGDGCRTNSLCKLGLGQRVGDGVVIPRLGDRVGEGEELRGITVGGRGQAEMLRFSLDLDGRTTRSTGGSAGDRDRSCGETGPGRGTNDVKVSGVDGILMDGGRKCLPIFMVSTFETAGF